MKIWIKILLNDIHPMAFDCHLKVMPIYKLRGNLAKKTTATNSKQPRHRSFVLNVPHGLIVHIFSSSHALL